MGLADEFVMMEAALRQLRQAAMSWPSFLQDLVCELAEAGDDTERVRVARALLECSVAFGLREAVDAALREVDFQGIGLVLAVQLQPMRDEASRVERVLPLRPYGNPCAIHGTPITPLARLREMVGASFCVSFFAPEQLNHCIALLASTGTLLLDNGAFSAWKQGLVLDADYWAGYWRWAFDVLDRCEQAVAIIPDVIDGDAAANMAMIEEAQFSRQDWETRLMPVWHLHEPLDQLARIVEMGFRWVAFGSSGEYSTVGTPAWDQRVDEAFATIERVCEDFDEMHPRVHMLRGLGQLKRGRHPFATADSTNIARNHAQRHKAGEDIGAFRARIERDVFPVPERRMWPHSARDDGRARPSGVQGALFSAQTRVHS